MSSYYTTSEFLHENLYTRTASHEAEAYALVTAIRRISGSELVSYCVCLKKFARSLFHVAVM